ncbi:nucleoside diphosphate kinase 7-like isoform X3 [Bombyx mandarina]|uniref:Nucleoside diphosphate kinase 7-like isoform X3 n=1 Tax=Bombyx mandarina TaxID=7092 RepID=A0A6J2KEN1_BOMMA|nr:nucleoside diphosphate kinase 7-like isoform X3 [Bombyx mandarina]
MAGFAFSNVRINIPAGLIIECNMNIKLISNISQVYDYFDKYSFLCEMYDEDADEIKDLTLNYFPFDNSVQIIDAKKGKNVLKRVQLPPLNLDMLQIGNIVNIFSKLLYIKDCAPATRKTLFKNVQSTFAMIKPIAPSEHGKIITFIMKNGFRIVRMKNGKICKEFAMELYQSIASNNMLPIIIDYVTTGEVIGLELVAPDAVTKWRQCLGATDPAEAAPGTLRNLYGENKLKNVAHGCNTPEDAAKMLELFFGYEKGIPRVPFRATFKNCTCCVIKPHAVIEGNIGSILEQISTSGKFFISAMAMFSVKLANATEFFEVYKGVLPEYEAMCIHLAEGKCVVLEVTSTNLELNSVCEFRKMCGPRDPDLCRQLYPESIRALYGKSIVHNAVHCTDLPEDGELEVEYFFKLVAND